MPQAVPSASSAGAPETSAAVVPSQNLEDRYNTAHKRNFDRRLGWGLGGALLIAGVGFLFLSGWQNTNQVSAQDIGYTKTGDLSLSMRFEVNAPTNTPVACAIEALNTSKATVGWSVVELPASDERIHTVTAPLRTTTPATAVTTRQCWVVE